MSEKFWLTAYFFASTVFRAFVYVGLFWLLASRWFAIGALLALGSVVSLGVAPVMRFAGYLATSAQLLPVRSRAITTTVLAVVVIVLGPALVVMPEYCRLEGVAEPRQLALTHAGESGFIVSHLPTGTSVTPDGPPLVVAESESLRAELGASEADLETFRARKRLALRDGNAAAAQVITEQIAAAQDKIAKARRDLARLAVTAPFAGTWLAPRIEWMPGSFAQRGRPLGQVASLDAIIVRAAADQQSAARIIASAENRVELRVRGRPELVLGGIIEKIRPGGEKELPSAALGFGAGGSTATDLDDPSGRKTRERTFEVVVRPDLGAGVRLLSGQRVLIRVELPRRSLMLQWGSALRRLAQERLQI